jgi:streptogramin lyase
MKKLIFISIGISVLAVLLGSCAPQSSKHSGPVAYTSPAGVTAPDGIAIDASGNVWVLGQAGYLAEINSRGTVLTTYSLPPNNSTGYTSYAGIAIAASGNIWAVNYDGDFVARLVPSNGQITKYPTGIGPYGIAIDPSGNVWVGDTGSGLSPYSSLTEFIGSTAYSTSYGTSPVNSNCVESVAIDGLGYVWLSGCGSVYIVKASTGTETGSFAFPSGGPGNIAIDQSENAWTVDLDTLYLLMNPPNNPVLMYSASGADFKGIAIDQAGNVWVTDNANATLLEFNPSGTLIATFAVGNNPSGIAIDAYGDVWVTNTGDNTVTEWMGIAAGPQYFPYTGPQFPGGQP